MATHSSVAYFAAAWRHANRADRTATARPEALPSSAEDAWDSALEWDRQVLLRASWARRKAERERAAWRQIAEDRLTFYGGDVDAVWDDCLRLHAAHCDKAPAYRKARSLTRAHRAVIDARAARAVRIARL